MRIQFIVFAAVFLCFGSSGCGGTDSVDTGSLDMGSFAGRVILFDSTGNTIEGFSGVRVSIDGTLRATMTDSKGDWVLDGVTEGTYDLSATKDGYGTYHFYQQVLNGGRISEPPVALVMMPATPVRCSGYYSQGLLSVNATLGASPFITVVYCDLDSNTKPSDAHLGITYGQSGYFSYADLRSMGVTPGQHVYLSASTVFSTYGGTDGRYEYTFIDPSHNYTNRYASTGPKSNVVSVLIP